MTRWLTLLPEIVLSLALLLAFGALLVAGPRAGRAARFALFAGVGTALVASLVSREAADEFLFHAYRIDPLSQLIKTMVLTGSLLAAVATRGEDRWVTMRTTSPFFHLVTSLALVLGASLVDVLALSLAMWMAAIASMLVASSVGRWSVLEKVVRRALAGWLGALVVSLAGGIMAAALSQSTRIETFRLAGDRVIPGLMRAALVLWSAGAVWLVVAAPVQLQRLANDPSGSRAAPMLGSTAFTTLGGLLLLRAFTLSAPDLPAWTTTVLLAIIVLPAPLVASQRFAFSFLGEKRALAIAGMLTALAIFGAIAWPWITAAAAEL